MIASHNGTEFTCIAMLTWSKAHCKPMHNGLSASTIGGGMFSKKICPSVSPGPILRVGPTITMAMRPGYFTRQYAV